MYQTYTTKQGSQILELLKSEAGRHFTADEIIKTLSENGKSVGKATVYRHMDKLIRAGLVRKYLADGGGSACFAYVENSDKCHMHYHLKCSSCGKLLHVDCEYLDKVASHILGHHGFVISPEKTVLYGICEACREAENEK